MTIQIRSFEPADQSRVRELIEQGLQEHFGYLDRSLNPDLDDLQATYISSGGTILVAEVGQNIVGTGALICAGEHTARLVRVSVDHRWRKRGIARTVVSHLIELATENQYHEIIVETNLDWYAAITLYQQLGFIEYAQDDISLHMILKLC